MTAPLAVSHNGHRAVLKWHRARRRTADPVFTGKRILEGMAAGASVEVDLVVHGEHGFAVLHDHTSIARETTGTGSAASHTAAQLRALNLRGNDGTPIADRVMLLDDLCGLLAGAAVHPAALLQLDYKEGQRPLARETIAAFARAVGPVAGNMILSSGEGDAVEALTSATPGLHVGYDPCHGEALASLRANGNFADFVTTTVADSPRAEMIYLAHELVLAAADADYDIVAALHRHNRRIDAYTIRQADAASRTLVERLLALGVDQITTDDPEGLAALIGEG